MLTDERESSRATSPVRERAQYALEPQEIVRTIEVLHDRISERFPGSGLGRLCETLVHVASGTVQRLRWVAKPHLPLRIGAGVLIALILAMLVTLIIGVGQEGEFNVADLGSLVQVVESILNDVFLIGASIFFLVTMEGRIKRQRALRFLRELRAIAHIVDMHQLTKDPDRFLEDGTDTPSSPARRMTRYELGRYLDYCSEMLSLISKIAALYVQNFDDPVVLAAVDEVETLTTGLSGRIWQKIMILEQSSTLAVKG